MAFKKGQSGNPGGRSRKVAGDGRTISEIAKEHSPKAIATLVDVMDNGDSAASRVSAANAILDRAWGRPKQDIDVDMTITDHAAALAARRKQATDGIAG